MRRALDALPPLARKVFELHAMQAGSFSEIAEALSVSADDVEHLLATALIALDRARDGTADGE